MSAESKSFLCRCLACGWVGVGEECQNCVRQGRAKDVLEVKETDAKKSDYYKARMFEQIQAELWTMATHGNLLQSTVASALIRELFIEGPDGQEPEEA